MVETKERPNIQKITSLLEKFSYELCLMYDAENRFLEAQQILWQCCENIPCKSATEIHIQETEQQIQYLEEALSTLGKPLLRITCESASGMISDFQKLLLLTADNPKVVELSLIEAHIKVEQFEIASYQGLIKTAEELEQKQVVKMLQKNLRQEEVMWQKMEKLVPDLLQEAKGVAAKVGAKSR
jgi:ferritin-like metal-binding protein YciE